MTDRKLMQQAMEFIDSVTEGEWPPHDFTRDELVEALRARLAQDDVMINGLTEEETAETMSVKGLSQPEPEPVAWLYRGDGMVQVLIKRNDHFFSLDEGENFIKGDPLYTALPQRK